MNEAVSAFGAQDLDRRVTSSAFTVQDNYRRWVHAADLENVSGSAFDVSIQGQYVFVTLHWNPSACDGLMLGTDGLSRSAGIVGGGRVPTINRDGSPATGRRGQTRVRNLWIRSVDEFDRELGDGIALNANTDGKIEETSIRAVVQAVLRRP
jgi:sugar lactone lactonase YvrE